MAFPPVELAGDFQMSPSGQTSRARSFAVIAKNSFHLSRTESCGPILPGRRTAEGGCPHTGNATRATGRHLNLFSRQMSPGLWVRSFRFARSRMKSSLWKPGMKRLAVPAQPEGLQRVQECDQLLLLCRCEVLTESFPDFVGLAAVAADGVGHGFRL